MVDFIHFVTMFDIIIGNFMNHVLDKSKQTSH